ncbi:SPASM domain-containing protein [Ktedonosporobacter rubrisoli]|uniref:SPASM domain-containing protein n=1 Tax=Ktedonosporobacter rubrisoli TaxID=2509675 RepID=A0A4P6JR90_KTERU|nr:SPASM domain-containing protein [Ktedonosporobacter rubrisoli]QBD77702.1 SPASM domain-containing protein [Ktedonosporobacter rubrisoli]
METHLISLPTNSKKSRISDLQERKLRASSYVIYVDLPEDSEQMLLVHGYTGSYDLVSKKVATYVRSLEIGRPVRPLYGAWSPAPAIDGEVEQPSGQTVELLKRRGYLTEKTQDEEEAFFIKIAKKLHEKALRGLPNFVLMPTYDCNLRCAYCFQDHMRTDPTFSHLLRSMTRSTIDRIFAGISDIETRHDLPPEDQYIRNIGFFGGEPLLARNRRVIDYIIKKATDMGKASFWAVSNATELETYKDLLNPQALRMIQVTMDGPLAEHDKRRIYADGSGSYERIAKNVSMALEQGVNISLRMNIDRLNIEHLPIFAEEIMARGWHNYSHFSAYTAPIHAANDNTDARTTFNSWTLDKALNELRAKYPAMSVIHRPDDPLKDRARALIESKGFPMQRAEFCGAHASMYVIDPFANIYSCWERTGNENIRSGYITREGKYVSSPLEAMWRSRDVTTNKICRKCRYALNCGGGCAVYAEGSSNGENGIFTNHCDGYAARFRASVAEAYLNHLAGVEASPVVETACDR